MTQIALNEVHVISVEGLHYLTRRVILEYRPRSNAHTFALCFRYTRPNSNDANSNLKFTSKIQYTTSKIRR